jgi:hypothetical protein
VEHVDPEVLALASLGEPLDDEAREHVATCPECADEVAALAEVVAVGRAGSADPLLAPTPSTSADAPVTGGAAGTGPAGADLAPVVPLRRRRTAWVAAAAAAGLVVGGVGGALWMDRVRADEQDTVVAEVGLDPLPGWSASGDAFVEQSSDGTRTLVVSLDGEVADGGFREVWLIDRDVTRLVSLGVLDGADGRFTIPAGLDLAEFPVVDVSEEPFDGDPAHSGDSIIRGILPA